MCRRDWAPMTPAQPSPVVDNSDPLVLPALSFLSYPVEFGHGPPLSDRDSIPGIPNCLRLNLCWSVDLSVHTALAQSAWPQPCLRC